MDMELNFIGVCVVHWHSSYRIYTEILGMHAELDPDLGIWASLGGGWDAYRAGSKSLIVELFDGGRPAGSGRAWGHKQGTRPAIQVDDLEAVVVAAQARCVPFTGEVEETYWGQRIEFSAPEGIRWRRLSDRRPSSHTLHQEQHHEADHREGGVECSVVLGVDQRSAQRYAEHVAGGLREMSDAEGYRPFYLRFSVLRE